jgi:hypothetical protein
MNDITTGRGNGTMIGWIVAAALSVAIIVAIGAGIWQSQREADQRQQRIDRISDTLFCGQRDCGSE